MTTDRLTRVLKTMTRSQVALHALTTSKERQELRAIGTHVKLQYIGKQCFPKQEPLRLWNVMNGRYLGATRSIQGLREWGLIPRDFNAI